MIKKINLYLGFCLSALILMFSLKCRASEKYTDLTQGAEYAEDGVIYHPDGDGILNGVMVIPISSETETTNADSITIKERLSGIIDYAKGLFMEAKSDSITEEGSWLNGDIVVVILCVATVIIILLYVIFDFIRSPWKKKLKILLELVIAIGLVGGILWYFWNQAVKEQQKDSINYISYQKEYINTDIWGSMALTRK